MSRKKEADDAKQLSPASIAAHENQADILLINCAIAPGLSEAIRAQAQQKGQLRDRVIVILVSSGGIADDAYRAAAALRSLYTHVTVCVSGWCKSAGTLMAIGADELIFGCNGEMGPLDVQIAVKDELVDNRDSGLIHDAAVSGLTANAFRIFEQFMTSIIERSQGAITFRTAADLAAHVTIGLMAPVFEKIDPLRMGADQRAQLIGMHYAIRLNMKAENLEGIEALNMLLNGYPSHGFVIDLDEARKLFTNVKELEGHLKIVVEGLAHLARFPSDHQLVCYLDGDEDGNDAQAVASAEVRAEATDAADQAVDPQHSAPENVSRALQAVTRPARPSVEG